MRVRLRGAATRARTTAGGRSWLAPAHPGPRRSRLITRHEPPTPGGTTVRRHSRIGFAAVAAALLAAAGCSSSSSSSSTSVATLTPVPSTSAPASAGTGGQGAQSVTDYLTYVGGTAGPANQSLPPVKIGFINQQGGPTAVGLHATDGAKMAVNYANAELGGIGGHPIVLDTCFIASAEEE